MYFYIHCALRCLKNKDPSHHAEIAAIREACKALGTTDLGMCTMYVVGMPCPMCLSCAILANLKNIVYAVDVPKKDKALSRLPSTNALYQLVHNNYGAKAIAYKQLEEFSEAGEFIFTQWNKL